MTERTYTLDEVVEAMACENSGGGCCDIRDNGECCLVPSMRDALNMARKMGWELSPSKNVQEPSET